MVNYKHHHNPTVTLGGVTVEVPHDVVIQTLFYNHVQAIEVKTLHKNSDNTNYYNGDKFHIIGIRIDMACVTAGTLHRLYNNSGLDSSASGLIAEIALPANLVIRAFFVEYYLGITCSLVRINSETFANALVNRIEIIGYEVT